MGRSTGLSVMLGLLLLLWCCSLCLSKVEDVAQESNEKPEKDYKQESESRSESEAVAHQLPSHGTSKSDQLSVTTKSQFGFIHAFVASLSVIIVSEIGDKTFFIAAILAMSNSRLLVFSGALSALAFMTFLSVCLGFAAMFIPRWVTFYISTLLLAIFGLKMLYEGWNMKPEEAQEEFEEVSAELRKKDEPQTTSGDVEQGSISTRPPLYRRLYCFACLAPIFLKAFTLTFLAEWGDRSQLTTIILSAREDPMGVTIGGTLGHALCTALAVLGGKIIAQRISVRTVTLLGGVVFLVFALTAFLHDSDSEQQLPIK